MPITANEYAVWGYAMWFSVPRSGGDEESINWFGNIDIDVRVDAVGISANIVIIAFVSIHGVKV